MRVGHHEAMSDAHDSEMVEEKDPQEEHQQSFARQRSQSQRDKSRSESWHPGS